MAEAPTYSRAGDDDVAVSLLDLGNVVLRRRRLILALAVIGAATGLALGLATPQSYTSFASFIPQGADAVSGGGLAAAASQFGLRLPSGSAGGSTWGPPVYVDILRSRTLLEPIVEDSFAVDSATGRKVPLLTLLDISGETKAIRIAHAVARMQDEIVKASENKDIGAVNLSVTTRWPALSFALSQRLIDAINQFNLERRKSQATEELRFANARTTEAGQSLANAENRLQAFMQENRIANSPQLALERERLQRDVTLRQQVYTSLMQSREEARLREVRDTPVITLLEEPNFPAVGEPRKSIQKAIFGGLVGAIVGALFAFIAWRIEVARREPSEDARTFFALVGEATPRMLRRNAR